MKDGRPQREDPVKAASVAPCTSGTCGIPVRPASAGPDRRDGDRVPGGRDGPRAAINRSSGVTAVSLYLLAVVLAAAAAGVWGGLFAAALSFAGYIFFFTAPRFTFRVAAVEDVVAAVVLLLVALVVGFLVARVLDEHERTGRRERDARLLGYLATKLLSGEQLPRVLDDFAQALLDPFDLIRCEVEAVLDGQELRAIASRPSSRPEPEAGEEPGPKEVVPIAIGDTPLGIVRAVRGTGAHAFTATEHALLEATAKQAALAIERARLDARVRGAQLDAETNQLRAALFSSVTHDLRTPLSSIKASVTSLLSRDGGPRCGAATRAAHDGARGDRSVEPGRRQPDGPGEDPGGRPGARPRAGGRRRARADGRRADATAALGRPGAPRDPARSARRLRRSRADRSGPHEPARERRAPFAAGGRDPDLGRAVPRRGPGPRGGPGLRASTPRSASACSRRSIVGTRRPSGRGAGWGSRSRGRSWWATAGGSGSRAPRAGERSWCSSCRRGRNDP